MAGNKNKYYDPFSALQQTTAQTPEKKLFNGENNNAQKAAPAQTQHGATGNTSYGTGVKQFVLVRKDTNEKIVINKNVFKIGVKADSCDYVVTDNKYVGRNHAMIIVENGMAFFVDNNSTNKSYINGNQAAPNQKIKLVNGCEVKLANLPFTFYIAE